MLRRPGFTIVVEVSLRGLALGDAFGRQWFSYSARTCERAIADRLFLEGPWPWTDDTAMALSVVHALREASRIDRDTLAQLFPRSCGADPHLPDLARGR